jgi:hypothetical protein
VTIEAATKPTTRLEAIARKLIRNDRFQLETYENLAATNHMSLGMHYISNAAWRDLLYELDKLAPPAPGSLMEKPEPNKEPEQSICQRCEAEVEDQDHLVEAFETTGSIICLDCWMDYCEENQV